MPSTGMPTSIRGDTLTLIHEDDRALPIKEPYLATSVGLRARDDHQQREGARRREA